MTTIEIPQRLFTLMIRATEIMWDKLLEEAREKTSTDKQREKYWSEEEYMETFYELDFGNFTFALDYDIDQDHECVIKHGEPILLKEEDICDCDKDPSYTIRVSYNKKGLFYKRINEITLETAVRIVTHIKALYQICRCGDEATKDGWCDNCYIHRYTRTEEEGGDCSICYENEGRWVRLECKHEFHLHCYHKIDFDVKEGRRCPLCRKVSKTNVDCYDC